jgi:molybdopterin synthase catalytic subunit
MTDGRALVDVTLREVVEEFTSGPGGKDVGMVAIHVGVVRGWSRKGGDVGGIELFADRAALGQVLAEARSREGIVGATAAINEGSLAVGEPVMVVAVAGEIRDQVFPCLVDTVEAIKSRVTRKREVPPEAG